MAVPNREAYPTPALAEKQIDNSNPYKTPDWVVEGWPQEGIEEGNKIFDEFNKEHGTDYKFKLK